eukprot:TRINITY_DN11287_c0_g1_i1.p1 TRINITY_DN11287_c0_g1~~TRINITY_DN11287_c0_g1_i1.p1  ORF type:complete len:626 (-),score=72.79 TRINITY_DN11287_c0_g1_i1:1413-3290(-)
MGYMLGAPPGEFLKIWTLPAKIQLLSFKRRMVEDQVFHNLKISGGTKMRRSLTWLSFAAIGVGSIIATGVFSFLPLVYSTVTGPAAILSVLIGAVTAATSAMIYSEFSVEYPVVGGAYIYVLNTFGEYPAILCGTGLLMEYTFAIGAVARNFSVYLAELLNRPYDIFQVSVSFQNDQVDYVALALIVGLAIVCCFTTKIFDEGNRVLQVIHIFLVVFIMVVSFTYANTDYLSPFFPDICPTESVTCAADGNAAESCLSNTYGEHKYARIVTGASKLFFIFIGYDLVAISAEEAATDDAVPIGMLVAVAVVTVIYVLMSLGLTMLYPFANFACKTSNERISGFAYAFTQRNAAWMKYVVAAGACVGIFTTTGCNVYGLSRVFQVYAREAVIPPVFGYVHPSTATPIVAVVCAGIVGSCMGFFSSFDTLANMTSIGTLTMYWFVGIASLYMRYAPELEGPEKHGFRHEDLPGRPSFQPYSRLSVKVRRAIVLVYIFVITGWAVAFTIFWNLANGSIGLAICFAGWFFTTLLFQFTLPISYVPQKFALPWYLMPWVPSISIWMTIMLVGGFGATVDDYWRMLYGFGIGTSVYLFYGIHASYWRFYGPGDDEETEDEDGDDEKDTEHGE